MPSRSRRLLMLSAALLVSACNSTAPSVTGATPSTSSEVSPASASASTGEEPAGSASPSLAAGQTDTDWGRIWDAVPSGFPRFPGSTPAEDASPAPASARFAVPGGDPATIATWFQDALLQARFGTVGLNGPAEDGSFVLDSIGDGECRLQTTIAPRGDTTFISVLYGAGCPATSL